MLEQIARYVIGAIVGAALAYMVGRADGRALAEGEEALAQRVSSAAVESARKAAAGEIAKIEVRNVTVQQRLEKEIREKPVYLACRHSPDGLRILNAALADAEPAGGSQLPAADAAR